LFQNPQVGVPKFPKLGLSWLWGPIILCANLWLRWSLKQSCSTHRDLFNGMWHATCMQGNRGDSWLLMIESHIVNLTFNFFFAITCVWSVQMGHASPF
jgi:hypothetical protein